MMWKFLVKNQSIEIVEREVLADHQIQYVQFKFTFDGGWKRFHKVVQFTQGDDVYSVVLGTDGTTLYLPAELHAGAAKMAVFGYDTESNTTVRATTVPVTLNIRASGFEGDDPPIPPTPDLYTQLLKRIENTEHGVDGKSAYEIAVEHGFVGTQEEWLYSLHGIDGQNGRNGLNGHDGVDGLSAYEIASEHGYTGTEEEWLISLHGRDGITPDMSEYPKTSEVTTIIEREIEAATGDFHTHHNMTTLNGITESHVTRWNEAYTNVMNLNERVGADENVFERFRSEIQLDMQECQNAVSETANRVTALEQALSGVENALADIVEVTT